MKAIRTLALAALIGASLSLPLSGPAAAQELPTGAARIVEKVQTRIFISQATLTNHIAAIVANQPSPGGE